MKSLLQLFEALNVSEVKYLLAGGWAVNLYGIERATGDIDLVVHLEEGNLTKFVAAVDRLGLKPKAPVPPQAFIDEPNRRQWVEEKGMRVFSLFDPSAPYILVDVFIEHPFDFEAVFESRTIVNAGKIEIPLVPIKVLIEMKEKAGRPQDIADVYHLKQIEKEWSDD